MNYKIVIGLGLACAACCAIPLLGLGGLTIGGAGIAGWLGASVDQIVCNGGPLLIVVGAGFYLWQQSRRQKRAACPADGSCGCKASSD